MIAPELVARYNPPPARHAYALRRCRSYEHISPDHLHQLLTGDHAPGVMDQVAQRLGSLGTQADLRPRGPRQGTTTRIESDAAKLVSQERRGGRSGVLRGVHRGSPKFSTAPPV
jgi:hypothetical protein